MKTLGFMGFLHDLVLMSQTQDVILKYVVILVGDDDSSFPSGHSPIGPEGEMTMGDARDTAKKKKATEKKSTKGSSAKPAAAAAKPAEAAKPAAKAAAKSSKK